MLDRLLAHRITMVFVLVWSLAEATFFFIAPETLLSLMGARVPRPALKAAVAALAGALAGGALMYAFGTASVDTARAFLDRLPGGRAAMVPTVQSQDASGVLLGPVRGIPYKVYAVAAGARRGGLWPFLLISAPARLAPLVLSVLLGRGLARGLARWTTQRPEIEAAVLGTLWAGLYTYCFTRGA